MYYIKAMDSKSKYSRQWTKHRTLAAARFWYGSDVVEGSQWMVSKKTVPGAWDACPIYVVKNGNLKKTNDEALFF